MPKSTKDLKFLASSNFNPYVKSITKSIFDVQKNKQSSYVPDFVYPNMKLETATLTPLYNVIKPSNPLTYKELATKKTYTKFVANSVQFQPYEKFTSIKDTRPELLAVVNFEPLFVRNMQLNSGNNFIGVSYNTSEFTKHGRYCMSQYTAQRLMLINQIATTKIARSYSDSWKTLEQNKISKFKANLEELKTVVSTMQQLLKHSVFTKQQLDLREHTHRFKLLDGANVWNKDFALESVESSSRSGGEIDYVLDNNYFDVGSIVKTLVDYGYNQDVIRKHWSSTKIWLQFLIEYKALLETHSEQLAEFSTKDKGRDISSHVLQPASSNRFGIYRDRSIANVLPLKQLKSYNSSRAEEVVNWIAKSYVSLYNTTSFQSNEVKLSLLLNMFSKEFRYSRGMLKKNTRVALQRNFGQGVFYQSAIPEFFDAIVGIFGSNISEVPATISEDLMALAYHQPSENSIVMVFEDKYLDVLSNHSRLSPGGEYYVDSLFQLKQSNFSKLEQLIYRFDAKYHAMSTLGFDLNLVGQIYDDEDSNSVTFADSTMECADRLAASCFDLLLHRGNVDDGNDGSVRSTFSLSPLSGLLSYAAKDTVFKSILFAFFMNKVLRSYPDTGTEHDQTTNVGVDDKLLDMMTQRLNNLLPKLNSNVTVINDGLIRFTTAFAQLKTMFSNKNPAFVKILNFMRMIYETWNFNNRGWQEITVIGEPTGENVRTRYNGIIDTSIMMIMFDVLVCMFENYGNVQLDSIKQKKVGNTVTPEQFITKSKPANQVNFAQYRDVVENKLKKEKAMLANSFITVLSVIDTIKKNFQTLLNLFSDKYNNSILDKAFQMMGSDQELFDLLFSEQQMLIMQNTIADISAELMFDDKQETNVDQSVDNDRMYKLLDFNVLTPTSKDELLTCMYNHMFSIDASRNMCIATVGIPVGYVDNLRSVVKLGDYDVVESSFNTKQNDIVSINVYKIDVRYPDVVFKPLKYLFELSRFPVRNTRLHLPLPQHATLEDVISCVPTRDLSQDRFRSSDLITFYSQQSVAAFKGNAIGFNVALAFDDQQYSFLYQTQKREIYQNHVLSYIAELYCKCMTGLNIVDHTFMIRQPNDKEELLIPQNVFKELLKTKLAYDISSSRTIGAQVKTTTDYLFANPEFRDAAVMRVNTIIPTVEESLASVTDQSLAESIVSKYYTLNSINRSLSTYSDEASFSKRVLSVKKFDRIFNIFFDPDNFMIDELETIKSLAGKQALQKLIDSGEARVVYYNNNKKHWFIQAKDKNSGDVAFMKYFTVVEPLNDEVL
jgi:hypothetical protein